MSVANFTTLKGLPCDVEHRVVGSLDPDLLAALAEALVLAGDRTRRGPACPRTPVLVAARVRRVDEHAVVLALDLVQRVAQRLRKFSLAVMIVPSSLNSITACALEIACSWPWRSATMICLTLVSPAGSATSSVLSVFTDDRVKKKGGGGGGGGGKKKKKNAAIRLTLDASVNENAVADPLADSSVRHAGSG